MQQQLQRFHLFLLSTRSGRRHEHDRSGCELFSTTSNLGWWRWRWLTALDLPVTVIAIVATRYCRTVR
jgi:hypothetical protein